MGDVHIETIAYTKFFLHAEKYPHCAVNGLLIGENKGKGSKEELVIVDAVPLFHHSHNLAPMAEVALTKVDLDTQANKRMIVGYYAACENFYDKTPEKCPSQKIAEKILEFFPKAVFLVIDNSQFLPPEVFANTAISGYRYSDSKWKLMDSESGSKVNLNLSDDDDRLFPILLGTEAYKKLVDFDNYLDDMTLDWTNAEIENLLNNKKEEYRNLNDVRKPTKQSIDYVDDEDESSQDSSE